MNTNDITSVEAADCGLGFGVTRGPGTAQDRLIHLAMDELAAARAGMQSECWRANSAEDKNKKLSEELNNTVLRLMSIAEERDEHKTLATQQQEEITALKVSLAVMKSQVEAIESDPTKRRISQLLRRIHKMAPQRQFKVVLRLAGRDRPLRMLGASSANGVTTITVDKGV